MSRSKPSCAGTLAAMAFAVASAFVVMAAHDARADMVSKGGGFCRYTADSGRMALKNKDYRKAIASFNKAIEWTLANCKDKSWAFSGLGHHYSFRAEAYAGLGDFKRAAREISAILKENATTFVSRDAEWMFSALDAAIKRQPKDPDLRQIRARAYAWRMTYVNNFKDRARERTADYDSQLADRTAVVNLARTKTERAEALVERSRLYLSLSSDKVTQRDYQSQLVLQDLSKAIELDPRPEYYRERARFYRYAKPPQLALAIEDMSKVIALDPKDVTSYASRAQLYEQTEQPEAAIKDLTHALAAMSPQNKLYFGYLGRRAEQLRKADRLDEASSDYTQLIKREPKNARWRAGLMLVLLQQGRDQEAEAERKRIEKLDAKVLRNRSFVCDAADIRARRNASTASAAKPDDLRKAWSMGAIVALVPLQHMMGKPNEKADQAWGAVSNLVRAGEKDAGKEARGLDAIPTFKGSKAAQARQAIAFIFQQRKKVEAVLGDKLGDRARALFAVSSAGSMALGLNRMGVTNLNRQLLGETIEKEAPLAGLPCEIWIDTAIKATSRAKPADVVKAWDGTSKAARAFLAKAEKPKSDPAPAPKAEKKSEALPEKQKPKPEKAATAEKRTKAPARPECGEDYEFWGLDPNTIPAC